METEIIGKIRKTLLDSASTAIVLPERLSVDQLCAAIALQAFLSDLGKKSDLFSSTSLVPPLEFLPQQKIYTTFSGSKDLVIKVSGEKVKPTQLRYEKDNNDLLVYITPESGAFSESDVEVLPMSGSYDLIVVLGASNLDELGKIYTSNPEKFYNTPKITINNNIDQEYFSNLTWVELEASSLSEQLVGLVGSEGLSKRNDLVLTSLLGGIISNTASFRDPKTTPESLAIAANLVKHGARQQDIIQYLFKTKPFNLLQLWGRALARIKIVDNAHLYTVVTKQDFEKTQTTLETSTKVLEEIISMTNSYQLISLIAESEDGSELFLAAQPHIKLLKIARLVDQSFDTQPEPLSSNYFFVHLKLPKTTIASAEQIISTLKPTGI